MSGAATLGRVPTRRNYNQNCPIARGLDILGERWTLLILRELLGGPRRYGDLRAELPGIATNLLAERLNELQVAGLVDRADLPAPIGRTVYTLSDVGWQRVLPILQAVAWFGLDRLDPIDTRPVSPLTGFLAGILLGFDPGQRRRPRCDMPNGDRRTPLRIRGEAGPSCGRSG